MSLSLSVNICGPWQLAINTSLNTLSGEVEVYPCLLSSCTKQLGFSCLNYFVSCVSYPGQACFLPTVHCSSVTFASPILNFFGQSNSSINLSWICIRPDLTISLYRKLLAKSLRLHNIRNKRLGFFVKSF